MKKLKWTEIAPFLYEAKIGVITLWVSGNGHGKWYWSLNCNNFGVLTNQSVNSLQQGMSRAIQWYNQNLVPLEEVEGIDEPTKP